MLIRAGTSKVTIFGACIVRSWQRKPRSRARVTVGPGSYSGLVAFATEVPGSAAYQDVPVAYSEFRPVGEIPRTGGRFQVVSAYQPAGDQPTAINYLERRGPGGGGG